MLKADNSDMSDHETVTIFDLTCLNLEHVEATLQLGIGEKRETNHYTDLIPDLTLPPQSTAQSIGRAE